nr:unnamed protein product [Digitaria exilis]
MVIAVEGNGFVHGEEDEDGDRPIRYLPLGHVYSSSTPAPRTSALKKPCIDDGRPPLKVYYRRRRKKPRVEEPLRPPSPVTVTAPPALRKLGEDAGSLQRKGSVKHELLSLGSTPPALDGDGEGGEPSQRRGRMRRVVGAEKTVCVAGHENQRPGRPKGSVGRRWVELDIQRADPNMFVGLACKVFWPLDDDWYKGSITLYNEATKKHSIKYDDGETEVLSLADERIKFSISSQEMKSLNLNIGISNQDKKGHDELLALAVSFHDYQGLDPGDLVWAKITAGSIGPINTCSILWVKLKQAVPFLNGLLSSLHLKCKQASFSRSLEEAKEFLHTQQLPEIMLQLRKSVRHEGSGVNSCEGKVDSCRNLSEDIEAQKGEYYDEMTQIELGNLRVSNLGHTVTLAIHFLLHFSVPDATTRKIDGSTPNSCWKEIYSRIKEKHYSAATELERNVCQRSGSYMFGFSNPQIRQLIQVRIEIVELPNARSCLKYFENSGDFVLGYRAVHVNWKDLDFCNVCDMDEEYEDNLFLQCDRCRMMVHARCYGELKQLDGGLWLCNLCRPGAPRISPKCCLCPVTGGAMKPTTDGRWAHLACAIWIPETCLKDDRWKLVCSICGVSYGVCIQCSHPTCRVAYHPLCARAADLCVELEDDDKIHHILLDEDDGPCIRLLSYCKKHRQPSSTEPAEPSQVVQADMASSSGCARAGKSRIHGFGVFAKAAHKAGDMMIEYIGEIVRPPVSDIRERRIYNSLVGAGTYMFRIDDERVIDATRAGSIAHLINHSCEVWNLYPNCYSRAITVLGDEHIIIFAKRDIDPWEELTYDYRSVWIILLPLTP